MAPPPVVAWKFCCTQAAICSAVVALLAAVRVWKALPARPRQRDVSAV